LEARRPVLSGLAFSTDAGKKSECGYLVGELAECWQITPSSLAECLVLSSRRQRQEQVGAACLDISRYPKWSKEEQELRKIPEELSLIFL